MDKDKIQEITEECDNYKHTVWALLAFANHSRWDFERNEIYPDSQYSLGRRMTTAKDSKDNIVTPDLVVQRTSQYGLVCEAKKSLPSNREFWEDTLEQLLKYDTITEGWFNTSQQIDNYDIIFMTDISRSVDFGDFFEKSDKKQAHKIAIVGFEPTTETRGTFITLKKERGALTDTTLNDSLRRVTKVSFSKIEITIGKIKFYDSEPPVVYTTRIFWENICGARKSADTWSKDKKAHILQMTVEDVTDELQEFFGQPSRGEREQEIPNQKWVRKTLDFLVDVRYAEKIEEGQYTVFWKEIRGDTLERFAKLWLELKKKKPRKKTKGKQLKLFESQMTNEWQQFEKNNKSFK